FPGWPLTIGIDEQYGRKAAENLPTLQFSGIKDPVVQVINEKTGETIYTRRIRGTSFNAKVFDSKATYSVIAGNPEDDKLQTRRKIKPGKGTIKFKF
ncbi:MAG: hypothetical protein HOI65_10930, partial [Opitutae bacterium]|nr:hypothetical protein [Opitutae bacterium]